MPQNLKQYRYAKQLVDNKTSSRRQAALAAGYSPAMASRPGHIERSEGFQEIASKFAEIVTLEKLAKTVADGLESQGMSVDKHGGEHFYPNWFARLGFSKLAYQIHGVLKGRSDIVDQEEKEVVFRWLDGNDIINPEIQQIEADYEVTDGGQEDNRDTVQTSSDPEDGPPSDEEVPVPESGLRTPVGEDSLSDQRSDLGGGPGAGGVLVHSADVQAGQEDSLEAIEVLWAQDSPETAE